MFFNVLDEACMLGILGYHLTLLVDFVETVGIHCSIHVVSADV